MKKKDVIFPVVRIILDFIVVLISFFIARKLRLVSDFIPWVNLQIQTIDTLNLLFYSVLAWIILMILFSIHGLYSIRLIHSKIKELLNIFLYSFYSFLLFSVLVYLWNWFIFDKEIPRLIILFSFLFAFSWILFIRIILNNLQYFLMKKNIIWKTNLIIINNKKKSKIKEILKDIWKSNIYRILWYSNLAKVDKNNIKFIWFDDLKSKISNREVEEIIYIDSDFSKKELYEIWELTRFFWIRYRYLTNTFDITKTNTVLTLINDIPVLELKNTSLSWWNVILKRIFDLLSSLFLIIISIPIFIIVFILIKIDDPKAPVIFKNKRIWRDWKKFNLYKFRYMKWKYCTKESYNVSNTEREEALIYEKELIKNNSVRKWPLYKIKSDPRKTKVWNFIEKYSIDEIPQFFNVFIWNMSLVWPRPHQPREVDKYKDNHKRLLIIKPWITGMAQVNGREDNDFDDEFNLDLFYIENWSMLLDLKIMLKTFSPLVKRIRK